MVPPVVTRWILAGKTAVYRQGMRWAAVLICAGVWICNGQDARSLVERAVAADDHSDRLARDYTYKLRDEIRVDRAGDEHFL